MCLEGQQRALTSAREALQALHASLAYLASTSAADLTTSEQAECLRELARAESFHIAATVNALAAFTAQTGYVDDGQGSARSWLRWQARITSAAAAGAVGWMRRMSAHPAAYAALAAGQLSPSWARQICDWTDKVPDEDRSDADGILIAAAIAGAELSDLAGLAEEIRRRCARPDVDSEDDGFADRDLRLRTHYRGAAKLDGDLTPECAAALRAVLDALGTRAGPEDIRTAGQRDHDALEDMCRRLIASGGLPERAGQPTQISLHMTLEQLLGLSGTGDAAAEWAGHGATAGPGSDCDAAIVPVVTGHVDEELLDQLAAVLLRPGPAPGVPTGPFTPCVPTGPFTPSAASGPFAPGEPTGRFTPSAASGPFAPPAAATYGGASPMAATAARELVLTRATRLLSGPAGLAARLRTGLLPRPAAAISLPLDIGIATEVIPVHLRRAVALRDRHCAFAGCDRAPKACQVHHIVPRSDGGPTSLPNLMLLCPFHHLVAIHRWGWQIRLNPDGTTTATSPAGDRTLHSHGPPVAA